MDRNPHRPLPRADAVRHLRRRLLQSSYPRLQMMLLVALTAGAGLLASVWLRYAGLSTMGLRYPLAVTLAYGVFLGLLWLWMHTRASDYADNIDPFDFVPDRSSSPRATVEELDAGGSLDDAGASSAADAGSGLLDAIGGADEAAIPLTLLAVLLAICATLLIAVASVVWSAPVLFAELLLDGALAVGLYRRLRRADAQHWLQTAVRHTFWPFVLVLLFSAIGGAVLQSYAPEASTLAQALDGR